MVIRPKSSTGRHRLVKASLRLFPEIMQNQTRYQQRRSFFSLLLTIVSLIFAAPVFSQSIWVDNNQGNSIAVDAFAPETKKYGIGDLSGHIVFLSFAYQLNDQFSFFSEMPFAETKYEYSYYHYSWSQSESYVGNPYLGFQYRPTKSQFLTEFGVILPLTTVDKVDVPFFSIHSDFDWWEVYFSDILSIKGQIKYHSPEHARIAYRCYVGPTVFWDSDEALDDDIELLMEYGGLIGFDTGAFSLMGGFTGISIITEEGISFDERTNHQIGITANAKFARIQPGLYLRKSLDAQNGHSRTFVMGCYLSYQF